MPPLRERRPCLPQLTKTGAPHLAMDDLPERYTSKHVCVLPIGWRPTLISRGMTLPRCTKMIFSLQRVIKTKGKQSQIHGLLQEIISLSLGNGPFESFQNLQH